MSDRTSARDGYDAEVGLLPHGETANEAFALAKFTFDIVGGALQLAAAEPLLYDYRDPTESPRLRPGTDFWPHKEHTDFVVRGLACAPRGLATTHMKVVATFGEATKRVQVFGRRAITFHKGLPRIEPPETFTDIPLDAEHAYGGIDYRVTPDENATEAQALTFLAETDHPGLYPRNPFGKGYSVIADARDDLEMPNLEDPTDLLTVERLIVGDPRRWYEQPLPWHLDWVHAMTFPRYCFFGDLVDAWFPGPQDERLPEVRRGLLTTGYRTALLQYGLDRQHPRFRQEASHGLVLPEVRGGEPVSVSGMHPDEPTVAFTMPAFVPRMEFEIDGARTLVKPRLHSVVMRPAEKKVNLVFGANVDLPRYFVPGMHSEIPVAVAINNDAPVRFRAPPAKTALIAQ